MTADSSDSSSRDVGRRIAELEAENRRLRDLLGLDREDRASAPATWEPTLFPESLASHPRVTQRSPSEDKVALFRSLFRGRDDVHALRWDNQRTGKSGWGPAVKGGWANTRRPDRELLPFTDTVAEEHLAGKVHVGLYPLGRDDKCHLVACDFDGPGWGLDSLAYLDAARAAGIPAALERSRSGDGGHVWIFFRDRVPATIARRIGAFLVREAMTVRAELDLVSYDRLFPAQDFLPKQGFGNLIALPLQGECRKMATTVFLDPSTLEPYPDQWEYLSTLDGSAANRQFHWPTASAISLPARTSTPTARVSALGSPRRPRSVRHHPPCWQSIASECRPISWPP